MNLTEYYLNQTDIHCTIERPDIYVANCNQEYCMLIMLLTGFAIAMLLLIILIQETRIKLMKRQNE